MAFWSGAKLASDGKTLAVVDGFDEKQIDCSAYTLRMGSEFYVTPSHGFNIRKSRKRLLREPEDIDVFGVKFRRSGESFVIPPGQFAFLLTEEAVKIPDNTMGFLSLKSRTKFKGLINVSGFHVDPGFSGNLVYSVFNAGPSPISLQRGENLFLLWIADLEGPVDPKYKKDNTKPLIEISSDLISGVARETHSLQALSERVEGLAHRVTVFTAIAVVISTVSALFLAYLQVFA